MKHLVPISMIIGFLAMTVVLVFQFLEMKAFSFF